MKIGMCDVVFDYFRRQQQKLILGKLLRENVEGSTAVIAQPCKVVEKPFCVESDGHGQQTGLPGLTSCSMVVTASEPSQFSAESIMPSLTRPFLNSRGGRLAMKQT